MTNKSIRNYINLIESVQREVATEGSQKPNNTLEAIVACFDAAEAEGLQEVLANTQDDRLKDLVERRLMHALYYAQDALQKQGIADEQLEETTPNAVAKVEQLFRHK